MKKVSILAFTQRGRQQALKLKKTLSAEYQVDIMEESIKAADYLESKFHEQDTFIFVCAAGIAVRMIAPLIESKDVDPAVLVMDELGQYVIPILSGHLGGGNEAAEEIHQLIGATPVLTTATDINEKFAVDLWTKYAGCKIIDISGIKIISSAILNGKPVGIESGFPFEGNVPKELTLDHADLGIAVSLNDKVKPYETTFNVVPNILTLGVGCRKGTSVDLFEKYILDILNEQNISIHAIEKIASIDLKKFEKCILAFSEKYQIPFVTFSPEELDAVQGDFESSEFVKSITGVDNVCERSAILGSGNGRKILSKTSGSSVTAALAMKDWKCKF
ncbi:cobalt-precorrin 5A hydrolase [Clostridiales Family XIII bacterium PM5-7]